MFGEFDFKTFKSLATVSCCWSLIAVLDKSITQMVAPVNVGLARLITVIYSILRCRTGPVSDYVIQWSDIAFSACQPWIPCRVVCLLLWNLACDILMALAIKSAHNSHLTLVMFPHYLTLDKIQTAALRSWSRGSLTLGPYSSGHRRGSRWPVANMAACMCKGKGMSLRTPTVI